MNVLRKITIFVVGLHLLLIGMLLFSPPKKIRQPAKHLVVRTQQPHIPTAVKMAQKSAGKSARPSAQASAPVQKAVPKETHKTAQKKPAPAAKAAKAAPAPVSAPAPAPAAPKQKGKPAVNDGEKKKKPKEPAADAWVEKAPQTAAQEPAKKTRPQLFVPAAPAPLQIENGGSQENTDTEQTFSYPESLIGYLHAALHLPEYGEVKIQLTLHPDGSVVKMAVLSTESTKNKVYLEKNIPTLKFPHFEGLAFTKNEQTFILTFCNEI